MSALTTAAPKLGGEVAGNAVRCPGPNHSDHDRSLKVWFSPEGQPRVHSFAGDDWCDCLNHVRQRLGLEAFKPRSRRERDNRKLAVDRPDDEIRARKATFMRDLVRRIWGEAGSCFGTLAQDYLRSREIELDDDLTPRVLRFHPRRQFGPKAQAEIHPALLVAYTPIEGAAGDDKPVSLHRIGLTPNAKKISKGMSLGSNAGCAIMLDADEDVTTGLHIAEGLETALAARERHAWRPMWCLGSEGGIRRLPPLPSIGCLTIAADHDHAGLSAAQACAERWAAAGSEVFIRWPDDLGRDFAD